MHAVMRMFTFWRPRFVSRTRSDPDVLQILRNPSPFRPDVHINEEDRSHSDQQEIDIFKRDALPVKLRTAFSGKRPTREINSNRRTGMRVSPAINERMSSGNPGRRYIRKKAPFSLVRWSNFRSDWGAHKTLYKRPSQLPGQCENEGGTHHHTDHGIQKPDPRTEQVSANQCHNLAGERGDQHLGDLQQDEHRGSPGTGIKDPPLHLFWITHR